MNRILVIDDDPKLRHAVRAVLVSRSFEVIEADGAATGLDDARNVAPDLVICDLHLNQGSGWEVLAELRQCPATSTLPVILITADNDVTMRRRGMTLGADDFLHKPFTGEELLAAVQARLKKQEVFHTQAEHSKRQLLGLLEATGDPVAIITPVSRMVRYMNRAARELTGLDPQRKEGPLRFEELFPPHALTEIESHALPCALTSGVWRGETDLANARGGRHHVLLELLAPRSSDGSVDYVSVIARDITERKRAENRVTTALQYSRLLLEASPIGIITYRATGEAVSANPAASRIVGASPEKLASQNFRQLESWKKSGMLAAAQAALRTGQIEQLEVHHFSTFGRELWLSVQFVPFEHEGEPHLLGTFVDISGRKEAESALTRERHFLRTLMENLPDAIYFKDRESRFLRCSRTQAEHFGLKEMEDVSGKTDFDFFDEEHARLAFEDEQQILRTGEPIVGKVEQEFWKATGQTTWALTTKMPLRNERGEIVGTFGISRDITALKAAESELRRKTAFFEALVNAPLDGILVVDSQGKKVLQNQQMNELWRIPAELVSEQDDRAQLEYVTNQVKDPIAFLKKVGELYERPDAISRDEIELKEGAVLDRFTAPVQGRDGSYYGRIWTFRDITERRRADEALRLQTRALEAAGNAIVITDREGRIIWVNPAFTKLTGYSLSEVIGRTPALLKSGQHDRGLYGTLWETILSGQLWHGELVNRRKDGTLYHEEMTITPVRDSLGEIRHFVAVKHDISQQREIQEALANERDLLQTVLDNLPDHIFLKDAHSRFTRVNRALAQFLNLPDAQAALGKNAEDFFVPRYAQQVSLAEQRLLRSGQPVVDRAEEMSTLAGNTAWVSSTRVAIRDRSGQIAGLVGVSRDITARRMADERLAKFNQCLLCYTRDIQQNIRETTVLARELFNADQAVYWHLEAEQVITLLEDQSATTPKNAATTERLRAFIEHSPKTLFLHHRLPDSQDAAWIKDCGFAGFLTWAGLVVCVDRQPVGCLSIFWRQDYDLEIEDQRMLGILAAAIGVEEHRWKAQRERELIEMKLRQAHKLEAIGQLAAGIAHEINTPTQYVGDNVRFFKKAFADLERLLEVHGQLVAWLKQQGPLPSGVEQILNGAAKIRADYLRREVPGAIADALEGVERVSEIVRAMKEFSHPGMEEKQQVDLNRAIESTLTVSRNEWKYVADLVTHFDPDLPPVPCLPGEFNQVILNLVVNASHAIAEVVGDGQQKMGTITVSTQVCGPVVEIRVQDTGAGIAERIRHRIFEPFFTTKPLGKGSGQGLALAHAVIVERHGGTLQFESEMGQGTTFIIRLPLQGKAEEPRKSP